MTYVDLEAFGGISDAELLDAAVFESIIHHLKQQSKQGYPEALVPAQPARVAGPDQPPPGAGASRIRPGQTAYLRADVPETFVLNWL